MSNLKQAKKILTKEDFISSTEDVGDFVLITLNVISLDVKILRELINLDNFVEISSSKTGELQLFYYNDEIKPKTNKQ